MNAKNEPAPPRSVERLDLDALPIGVISRLRIEMVRNGMGDIIKIPVLVARGRHPGPILGITAAVHGNELNGVRIIHRLMPELPVDELHGTIVAVPVVNVPGYLMNLREFNDFSDLNRLMPGREGGTSGEVYAFRFVDRIVRYFEYHIDLHTASFGRENSLYVRADLTNPVTARMAYLQNPQIVVHNQGADGTLRSAAADLGIHAITVEVGDPMRFQRSLIKSGLSGILNVMTHLRMLPAGPPRTKDPPVVCGRSYWLYTDRGGVLQVFPEIADRIRRGDLIARVSNMFGDVVREYFAPEDGIVIGKSSNPVNQAGSRVLHLGIVGLPDSFPDPTQSGVFLSHRSRERP